MSTVKQFIRAIPVWAWLLVLFVVSVNTIYLIYRFQIPDGGANIEYQDGKCVVTWVDPNNPIIKTGIRPGDILIKQNSFTMIPDLCSFYIAKAGDTINMLWERDNKAYTASYVCPGRKGMGFFVGMYIFILLVTMGSLFIPYKKPADPTAGMFFIFIQLFAITTNAAHLEFQDPVATGADMAFLISSCLLGPVLIHFYLLFPRRAKIYTRIKYLPFLFYGFGIPLAVIYSTAFIIDIYRPNLEHLSFFLKIDRIVVSWMTFTFFISLVVSVYQYITIKNSLARNQLRLIIIGSFFGFITPMTFALFHDWVIQIDFPYTLEVSHAIGSSIMIILLLVAIFRYRIWDTEIFIRKALLYLGATLFITLSYLLLIWLADQITTRESNINRFMILAVSVILFLILRDSIQHLIDRLFHRETYDSATVVSEFEEKLAGIYQVDELKQKIVQGLDQIFHFKSFVLSLKRHERFYNTASLSGVDHQNVDEEFEISQELEWKLRKSKIFSPDELNKKLSIFDGTNGELVVPMIAGDQPAGFFICGPKRSERVYSLQDMRVLSLMARRVNSLFHTASLYQKDLDRQLMLERERARISQDMHDDIGAGLTKIAMISEARATAPDPGRDVSERMRKVASTSREMITRLNVIVWALNPKYDTLDSLVAYARRYFGEYLDNSGIRFIMEVPGSIPDLFITPDFRRNAFYAMQEAIHNAVKHGACCEITMRLEIMLNILEITITDNGKGFDQVNPGLAGNGLLNMKKRAEDMGGSFEIKSAPGDGTKVLFLISLNNPP